MSRRIAIVIGLLASLGAASSSFAGGGYQESVDRCLSKHANTRDTANVLLECSAEGGKLANCKVLENSAAGKGFDKAAMCIADTLPMGAKTGAVKVPFRFAGQG
jgi:hypothetical protein